MLSAVVWNQRVAIVDVTCGWEGLSKIPFTLTDFSCPIINLRAESSMGRVMCFIFISQIFFEYPTKAW